MSPRDSLSKWRGERMDAALRAVDDAASALYALGRRDRPVSYDEWRAARDRLSSARAVLALIVRATAA